MKNKLGTGLGAAYGAAGSMLGAFNLAANSSCDTLSGSFSLAEMARNYDLSNATNALTYILSLPSLIPGMAYEAMTNSEILNCPEESALVFAVSAVVFGAVGNMVQRGIREIRGKQELGSSPSK
ncbi:MAG: hypothetical protein ABH840_00920 [Nanoarchaeota archaeon]